MSEHTDKWVVINPEGDITAVTFDPAHVLEELYRLIGCDTVDVVRLHPDTNLDMWVDDNGMITRQPINWVASEIAGTFGFTSQPYVGTVVLAQSDDEGETIGLEQSWLDGFLKIEADMDGVDE